MTPMGVASQLRAKRDATRIDFGRIASAGRPLLPVIVRRWLPDGQQLGCEWVARNPTRADRRPGSFKINLQSGRWAEFATGAKGGDVISLAAYLFGLTQAEAARTIAAMLGIQAEGEQ